MDSDMLRRIQICSAGLRYAQMDSDMLRWTQICLAGLRYALMDSDMLRWTQICADGRRYAPMDWDMLRCSDGLRYVQMDSDMLRWTQICSDKFSMLSWTQLLSAQKDSNMLRWTQKEWINVLSWVFKQKGVYFWKWIWAHPLAEWILHSSSDVNSRLPVRMLPTLPHKSLVLR